jgi:phenylpropionate dioxygenase-like ring-hydroxylating dioxygenase large terminal subunit
MTGDPVLLNDWHPVATVAELKESPVKGTRLLDEDIVVWRATNRAHAWRDSCVHRGTKLSLGKIIDGNCIQCAYHGWVYDGEGQCIRIPAMPDHTPAKRARIKTFKVREEYGLVWVCMGEPANEIAPFPEWHKREFRKLLCGPHTVQTSGPRIIENFLDVAHFPYVHDNVLGVQEQAEIIDYEVTVGAEGVVASNVKVYQPDPYGTGVGDFVTYTYTAPRPLTAYLLKESEGPQFSILLVVTPHSPIESTAWMWMTMNYGHDIPDQELIDWQNGIFGQDQPVVESQRPKCLPLDPKAEMSMRPDKTAVSYRHWLRELGMTFGVEA